MTRELNSSNSSNGSSSTITSTTSSSGSGSSNNIINIQTPYETSLERIDLVPLKKKLDEALKDRAEDYWEWMKKYLCGRLSKRELDYYILTNLTSDHLPLHNKFFKSVIFNAFYANTSPQIIEPVVKVSTTNSLKRKSSSSKDKKKDSLSSSSSSVSNSKSGSAGSSKESRKKDSTKNPASKKAKTSKKSSSSTSSTSASSSSVSTLLKTKKKKLFPKYSLFASQLRGVKNKMELIASENGLTGISKESILYMQLSLQQHMSNFIKTIKPHILPPVSSPLYFKLPSNQIPPPQYIGNQYNNNNLQHSFDINKDDGIDSMEVNLENNNNNNNSDDSNNQQDVNIENNNNSNNDNNSGGDISMIKVEPELQSTIPIPIPPVILENIPATPIPIITTTIPTPTTFNFNSIFNFNNFKKEQQQQQELQLELNYPKYINSQNPMISQPMSFYKIPDNLFSSTCPSTSTQCSILSNLDLFTSVQQDHNTFLRDDPISFERVNFQRLNKC